MAVAGRLREAVPMLLLAVLAAAGCQAHQGATLVYPPPGEPRADAPPQAPPDAPAVALLPVRDERPGDRSVVGTFVRLTQSGMTPVHMQLVTTDDAPGWVRGALRRELQLAGLAVVDAPAASGAPALDVALLRLSCEASEESHAYVARVDLRAVLGAPGRALVDDVYRAGVRAGIGLGDAVTDEGIAACLATGLRDGARRIAADAARALRAAGPAPAPAAAQPPRP